MIRQLILVKHAEPVLEAAVAPRLWQLGPEGAAGSRRLARALEPYQPFALAASPEPKALATAAIVGQAFGIEPRVEDDLRELDRPALPIMPPAEHRRVNERIFRQPGLAVLGQESAGAALARFSRGIDAAIAGAGDAAALVVVAHGTVIALLAAAHNDLDAFDLWKRLQCPSFVVMTLPGFDIQRVEEAL